MVEIMKIGINNITDGFQVAFIPTADAQAHFEFVAAGERKVSGLADALLREVSEEEDLDVSALSLDEYSERLDIGNHSKVAIMATHSEGEYGSCVLFVLGVGTVFGVLAFNDTNWEAGSNAVWDNGVFKREYSSPNEFSVLSTVAIAGIQPDLISIEVKNIEGWAIWLESSAFTLWFGDHAVNANEGDFYVDPEETTVITFSVSAAWAHGDLDQMEIYGSCDLTSITFPSMGFGVAGLIEEIELPATDLRNSEGNFSEVQVIDAKGFAAIYPLVKELSPGNAVKIYAWPL
jgi:hypothetical protein